jgi:hypothetical protein
MVDLTLTRPYLLTLAAKLIRSKTVLFTDYSKHEPAQPTRNIEHLSPTCSSETLSVHSQMIQAPE